MNTFFLCCHHDWTKVRLSYDSSYAIFSSFQYIVLDHYLDALYCCQPIVKCIGENQETVSRAINWQDFSVIAERAEAEISGLNCQSFTISHSGFCKLHMVLQSLNLYLLWSESTLLNIIQSYPQNIILQWGCFSSMDESISAL